MKSHVGPWSQLPKGKCVLFSFTLDDRSDIQAVLGQLWLFCFLVQFSLIKLQESKFARIPNNFFLNALWQFSTFSSCLFFCLIPHNPVKYGKKFRTAFIEQSAPCSMPFFEPSSNPSKIWLTISRSIEQMNFMPWGAGRTRKPPIR